MRKGKLWDKLWNILFPPDVACAACGEELQQKGERQFSICQNCQKELEYIGDKEQKITNPNLHINQYATVFKHQNAAKALVLRFKDGNRPYLRETIAKYLMKIYNERQWDCDFICYVPSSKTKIKQRGFDHMKLVAEYLSLISGMEVKHLLSRKEQVMDQTQSTDRYANIRGCFYYDSEFDLKGKSVLILDDVVTTGATASECAKVLKLKGAKEACLLTFTEAKSFEGYKEKTVSRMKG